MATEKGEKSEKNFICEKCDFKCSTKCDWLRHTMRLKHKNNVIDNNLATNMAKTYVCDDCGKTYSDRTGLWKHKQKCNNSNETTSINSLTNLVIEIVKSNTELQKQNQDFKELLMEQNTKMIDAFSEAIKYNSTVTNNVNSNNKTFNLNLFLHEDCKDAMNMSEFLESIRIQLADVEAVGELGYVNGISKLIIQNLKALDVTKRPVHCTDDKREIIYIKEAGVWTKDEDCSKLRRLIKTVSNRNFKQTRLYKEKHPDCVTAESKYSDTYNKIVLEATGGGSKCNDYESENKIMKKIAKAITIDKSAFA
jgi:ribosomal protein L37AE/L43A